MVDFLGIGASKCATTELSEILNSSSEIFIPPLKEIYYFNDRNPVYPDRVNPNFGKNRRWYHAHFDWSFNNIGEVSPIYFTNVAAPKAIHEYNPDIKLFVILRHPVERAYSQWKFERQRGVESSDNFIESLRRKDGKYINESLYGKALERYLKYFGREQIHIIFFEDYIRNKNQVVEGLLHFLGIDDASNLSYPRSIVNKGKDIKSIRIVRFIGLLRKIYITTLPNWIKRVLRLCGQKKIVKCLVERSLKAREDGKDDGLETFNRVIALRYFINDIEFLEDLLKIRLETWKK